MLISFIITTWLLAMLPGVGQALMLRQTLARGPQAAVATILGTSTGLLIWAAAAAAGLSAAVVADPTVYRVLLGSGGAFLAYFGLRTLWTATRNSTEAHSGDAPAASRNRKSAYLAGLATNLGNPKAGVFAISLLPAFATTATDAFWRTLGLGAVWSIVTASWYLLFVWLVSRGRNVASRPKAQRLLSCISGVVLIAVGTAVALGI